MGMTGRSLPKVNAKPVATTGPCRGFSLRSVPSGRIALPGPLASPFHAHGRIPIRDVIASLMSGIRVVLGRPRSFVDRFSNEESNPHG